MIVPARNRERGIIMESPECVQMSMAAAMVLGYEPGSFRRDAVPTGLNLLLHYSDGCVGRCGYCGLHAQRSVSAGERTFIRVRWPIQPIDDVLQRMAEDDRGLKRICVSMLTHRSALGDMNQIIRRCVEETGLPVSALIAPTMIGDLGRLVEIRDAGADRVGIAIDAATPELFERWRGKGVHGPHRWEHYWQTVVESVKVFGHNMVGVHLVVGLGETEKEIVELIQRLNDIGALTHLFSFFPESGTAMDGMPQPPIGQYRRVQLARYIINEGQGRFEQMTFDAAGRLVDFGQPIDDLVRYGEPFMTSGCPGPDGHVACNRPFGNERPGQPFRNFPFQPEPEDVELVRYQLRDYGEDR